MRGSKRLWIIALMMVLALVAAACGDDDDDGNGDTGDDNGEEAETYEAEEGTPMAEWQEEGSITIGVKFDVPPFGFENPQSNEIEGFDVDMGNYIADRLGVEAEYIEAISDNRIPFLADGTADLILSTMTITTDRDAEIDFSRPYYVAQGRILVPQGSDIAGIDDLGQGTTVCTALGSTYEATLSEQAPDSELDLVDAYSECLEKIQNESVDAVSTDDVILTGMVIQDENLQLVGDPLTTEPYGVGVAEGETEAAEFLSETIEMSFEDGTWDELYEEWVGQYTGEEAEHPSELTLEDAYELFPCDETC
ncbi:MAG TPA: glutamate ABC transporter substrate-binding protein [Actinomycetota bacterium]|nr:glutamate ABC transporter substrate-binding protein [Actinomycetota bacterium]